MKEKLTPKQKKFALEFLISGNITDAAKNAGYSERSARQIKELIFPMQITKEFHILHKGQLFRPEIRSWRCLVTRERETTWSCRKIC